MKQNLSSTLPGPAAYALKMLGEDISAARRRRRIPTALMAERAFIARTTLSRVEKGDPTVSIGIYASVLHVLGMIERLGALASPESDAVGLTLEAERLPKRITRRKQE